MGSPFTSADVKFTIEAIMDPANASPSKEFFAPVDRVETVDDYTVTLFLKDAYAPLLLALGVPHPAFFPKNWPSRVGMDELTATLLVPAPSCLWSGCPTSALC